ncbi:MAG: PKD-like domain-containing protein [Chitinophagales bacterium]
MKNFTPSLTKHLLATAILLLALLDNRVNAQTPLPVLQAAGTSNYGSYTVGLANTPSTSCNSANGTTPSAASIGRAGGLVLNLGGATSTNVGWGIDISNFYYSYNNSTSNYIAKLSQSSKLDLNGNTDIIPWAPETNMSQGKIYLRGTTSVATYNTGGGAITVNNIPIRLILTFQNAAGTATAPVKRNGNIIYVPMSQGYKVTLEAQVDASYLTNSGVLWLANCATHTGWQPALTIFDDMATTNNYLVQVGFNSSWYDLSGAYTVSTTVPSGVTMTQTTAPYTSPYGISNTGIEIAGRPGGVTYSFINNNSASGMTPNCYAVGFDAAAALGYSYSPSYASSDQGFYAAVDLLTSGETTTSPIYTDLSQGRVVLYGATYMSTASTTISTAVVRFRYVIQFKNQNGTANIPVRWQQGKIFAAMSNNGPSGSGVQINIQAFANVDDIYVSTTNANTYPLFYVTGYTSGVGWKPALDVYDYLANTGSNARTSVTFEYYTLPIPANTITVTESPVSGSPTDAVICSNGSVGLEVPNVVGNTYSWSPGGATTYNVPGITASNTYNVTITEGTFGCRATNSQAVVVNPTPSITNMTASTCNSFSVTPVNGTNGTVPGGTTYSWSAPSVTGGITGGTSGSGASSISGSLTNPTNTAQTATYTVTPLAGACSGSTFTVTVTVNPTPAVSTMSASACSGSAFTVTPVNGTNGSIPSGTTYSWTAPSVSGGITGGAAGSGTSIFGTLTNPTNTAQTATYTVTPTSGSCSGSSFTLTVTVNPKPAITTMTASTCSGVPFTATPVNGTNGVVPAGTTYSWTAPSVTGGMTGGAGGSGASISGTLTNPTTSAQTATYTVTPAAGGCTGSAFTLTATINALPTPTITPTSNVCANSTGNVYTTQSGMTNYVWTVTGGSITAGGGTSDNTVTVSWTTTNPGHVKVNYTNANGCTALAQTDQSITVNVTPAPTGSTSQTFCAINSPTVANLVATGTSIQWYAASTGGSPYATSTPLVDGNHYYATQTVGGCESPTRLDVKVGVDNPPAPTGSTTQNFCAINNPVVANLTATGASIQWYTVSSGGTPLSTSAALSSGHYYASQTVAGCQSINRLDVTVTVGNPAAPTGSATQTFCSNNSTTVGDLTATGTAIQWYSSSTGGTPLAGTDPLVSGTHYYASQTVSGCESATRLDVTAIINTAPTPAITPATAACELSTGNVYTTASGGSSYSWTVTGGTVTAGGGSSDNTVTIDWGSAGTGHIIINYTDANGCTATSATDQSITIDQAVTADADVTNLAAPGASSTQIEVCGALGTSLVANNPSIGTGTWTQVAGSGTTTYSPSANDNSVTTTISGYSAPAAVTYRWTVVNGGCSAYSDVVVVYDPPIVVSSVLAGCSFVPLPPFSNDSIMILVQATGGSSTLSFSYPPTDELRINVNSGTKVYTAPTNGSGHSFTVSDAFCAQSTSQTTPGTHITDIPLTASTGSVTATCYDKNFDKWTTFRDATNKALLSINDNNQDLGVVTVTAYRDATPQAVYNAGTNVCPGVQSVAMKRHFVITSTVAPTSPVTVRLYFTPTEMSDLISDSHANDISGNSCTELDNINSLSELYVTKYTGSDEDGDYSNNDPSGLYRVFGNTTSLPTQPDGPLSKYSNGFTSLFDSGDPHHYVEFNVTEFSEIWMHGSQNATPLPVEMVYFEANAIDNSYINLNWATAIEINNHGFEVERSLDGQNWSNIGWVDGHNNTTVQQNYTYNDYNVQPNVRYYYRLKQVDNDGMFEYTSIVSAIITGQITFNVKDFVPNPTNQNTSLIVTATVDQEVTVNLYNAIGQVVTSTVYHVNKGANQLNFDLSQLAVGTYTAVLSSANDVYSRKLVITR